MSPVPHARIRTQNSAPVSADSDFVLYWMTAARRSRWNFGLQRAAELAVELRKPLLVVEALRCDYPDASDRFHQFVVEGMAENAAALRGSRAFYYPYVEPAKSAGAGFIQTLAERAGVVVTDWFPAYFLPKMARALASRVKVCVEAIDSNGLIPVADHGRAFPTARGYRAHMQRTLTEHLRQWPLETPTDLLKDAPQLKALPAHITTRWPPLAAAQLSAPHRLVATLPIDHGVPALEIKGGSRAATLALSVFLEKKLPVYGDEHNDPDADCTSRLSPYLHFGHISAHEVFSTLMTRERWTSRKLGQGRAGAREGWWGVSPSAETFLDQLTVWRELAFNGCAWTPNFHSFESLPAWAQATLGAHLDDPRPHLYSLAQLDASETDDDVWNAAQRQLRREGWFHGYLRMLWGKKILECSTHPAEALERMEILMNRYSLDGRDPVSYASYGWVLGRYDRPWFDRPVFGTVRYMTSASAKRKLRMKEYLRQFS
ncbi:MAG: deoxyribodipyrimidine photolyase [Acidobacteria bacterium]|nr:deoxyribodipyrimidine photolyase [Acidobacteriota bacterium]